MRAKARTKYITEIMNALSGKMKLLTEKEKKSFGFETPEEYIASRLEDVRIDKLQQILADVVKNDPDKTTAAKILKSWGEEDLLVVAPEIRDLGGAKAVFLFHNSFLVFKQDRFAILSKNKKVKDIELISEFDSDDSILIKIKTVEAALNLLSKVKNDLDLTVEPYKELLYDFLAGTAYKENPKLEVSYKVFSALVEAYR